MAIAERTLTLEEFLKLPEEEPALEYLDGVITQKMSPQADHGWVQFWLAERFNQTARPGQLGRAFPETRFSTGQWAPVPDVSFYTRDRIRPVARRKLGDFREPPDIAVEIVSPDQSVSSLVRKCLRYLAVGVRVALLVDPDDESIFDFRPGQPMRVLRGEDRLDLDEILPGFELTARELFDSIVPDWLQDEAPASE